MNRKIGVLLSYILMVFEVISTLFLTPYIIRTLGQAEYGVYKLAAAINAYLLLLDLGVGNAITRYIAKYRVTNDRIQERRFLGVATVYYSIIAIIALGAGIILIGLFPTVFSKGLTEYEIQLGQELLGITMLNSAVTLGTAAYNNVIIAYERFDVSKGCSILQIILRMIFTYFVLRRGLGSIGIVTVNLIMTILCRGFFVLFVFIKIKLYPMLKGIKISFIKEVVTYSSLILLQMLATQINSSVDQVLIGALVNSSSVIIAVYGVGTQIVQYFQSMGSAFNGILMPGIVKMIEKRPSAKEITDEMIRISRIILMVLALIWGVFLIIGKEFIILWAGNSNSSAYYVAIILMTAQMFVLSESVGSQILWAMNQHKEQAILKIVIVLLNVFLTVLLIQWDPLIGATIGTFISLVLGDIGVMNFIFWKKIKIKLVDYYVGIFKGIIPSVAIMIIVGSFVNSVLPIGWGFFFLKAIIMVGTYITTMIFRGMNSYEKKLVSSFIKVKGERSSKD
mgnify:CR=1 FL=1